MAPKTPTFTGGPLRTALTAILLFQWISSIIVLGIVAYFINNYDEGEHLVYEIVIAAINAWAYGVGLFFPFIKIYKGYSVPVHLVFSYLWLTSFIFTAQDYNWHSCSANAPFGGKCSKKHALEAFTFLAFFFTFVAIPLDTLLYINEHYTVKVKPIMAEKNGVAAKPESTAEAEASAEATV